MNVKIARKLDSGIVEVSITDEEVGVVAPLEVFVSELANAVGNPATLMTRGSLLSKLEEASKKVQQKMKDQVTPYAHLVKK